MVVDVQDGRTAHHHHQNDVDHVPFRFLAARHRAVAPAVAQRLVTGHRWLLRCIGIALLERKDAGGKRDQAHDHLPRMGGAELAVRTKESSQPHHLKLLGFCFIVWIHTRAHKRAEQGMQRGGPFDSNPVSGGVNQRHANGKDEMGRLRARYMFTFVVISLSFRFTMCTTS